MTSTVDIQSAVVSFADLERKIRATKSESSARNYIAVVNRLRSYTGRGELTLSEMTPGFVAGFSDYLLRSGVTQSSVNHFKMILRAIFKDEFGRDRAADFKKAFRGVSSVNNAPVKLLTFDDVKKIYKLKVDDNPYFQKLIDAFLFCVFGGGLTFAELKAWDGDADCLIRHQSAIMQRFNDRYGSDFRTFVKMLGHDNYSRGLSAIADMAGIDAILSPDSAQEAWTALAVKADIDMDFIAELASRPAEVRLKSGLKSDEYKNLREAVADRLCDMRPRWYAMRCYGVDPDEMAERIRTSGVLNEYDVFETFVAPEPQGKVKAGQASAVIGTMLFFRCSPTAAIDIRRAVRDHAWVYTLAGTSIPAQISAGEMKTFMLLCDVSAGALSYHFPQAGDASPMIEIGQRAQIVDGAFTGYVGIVSALPDNKYKVIVTFTTLCATITAEVPMDFVKLV